VRGGSGTSPSGTLDGATAQRMLVAAAALFKRKGYARATTRELALLLGIQGPSLYHHISTKEDLLYRLCIDALSETEARVRTAVAQARTPRERLQMLIRTHTTATLLDLDRHVAMLLELRELTPDRREEVIRLRDQYEALIRSTLARAQRDGSVRRDLSAKQLSLALLNLLNWTFTWYQPEGELGPEAIGELLSTVFLDGALTQVARGETKLARPPSVRLISRDVAVTPRRPGRRIRATATRRSDAV
jgi:AcrR family transcriptional regulator